MFRCYCANCGAELQCEEFVHSITRQPSGEFLITPCQCSKKLVESLHDSIEYIQAQLSVARKECEAYAKQKA